MENYKNLAQAGPVPARGSSEMKVWVTLPGNDPGLAEVFAAGKENA